MTQLEHFQRLKLAVLIEYRKHYPYYLGGWKSFSSQDIQNLIALIEDNLRETVSEKWIYTHLKPVENEKLPRKDMLDIFSRFCGFSSWDEFVFEKKVATEAKPPGFKKIYWIGIVSAALLLAFWFFKPDKPTVHTVKVTDEFTGKPLASPNIKIFETDSAKSPIEVKDGKIKVGKNKNVQLVVSSPFYKQKKVTISTQIADTTVIRVRPDDHAMMLKAFMKSDIKDWQTRKLQLDKILSDDLEVIVMLKDDLGAEYFNKTEFSQKLIIPTPSLKKLKIVEIKNGTDQKIRFIRLAQE